MTKITETIRCLVICDKGFEDIVAKDLEDNFEVKIIEINSTAIIFSINQKNWHLHLAEICYKFQGAIKILSHIEKFSAEPKLLTTKNEILSKINILENIIEKETIAKSLKISCVRNGTHEYRSIDLAQEIARNSFNNIPKVFDNPDLEICIYINEREGYYGIDFSGRNLSKRDYKLFTGAASLRGTIAYNLFKFSGATQKDTILDPFMGSGTIIIEIGLNFSNTAPFYFSKNKFSFCTFIKEDWQDFFKKMDEKRSKDQFKVLGFDATLKFLKFAQKNAKIADINKNVNLSKVAIDWIDTKVEENSITKIITHPPYLTDHGSISKIQKVYKDLFYQAEFILKKEGEVTIITHHKSKESLVNYGKEFNFNLIDERTIFEGQQEMLLLKFKLTGKLKNKPKLEKSKPEESVEE